MMNTHRPNHDSMPRVPARRQFLQAVAAAGVGAALAGSVESSALAASSDSAEACAEGVQDIINTALMVEHLATTIYYTALTTRAIMEHTRMAGSSADPNAVAQGGTSRNVAYLQAALDQEHRHAQLLMAMGARSPWRRFYFSASTFESLGFTSHRGTFLWVLDHLETMSIGIYLAAVKRFSALGRSDLALHAMCILGVECEHRALYRMVSGDDPADNVSIEVASFACVGDARAVLQPYLTGEGFPGGAGRATPLPLPAQIAHAVGRNTSS